MNFRTVQIILSSRGIVIFEWVPMKEIMAKTTVKKDMIGYENEIYTQLRIIITSHAVFASILIMNTFARIDILDLTDNERIFLESIYCLYLVFSM